ncbi:MAG TPA: DUF3467 domain-containing protein [Bryobacteraceae bacterium]|nr:DUF3467 domain-containing protein [Bryobacteraceae bacterium]
MGIEAATRTPARVEGRYSNSFMVGYNAFEFLLDFGQAYTDDAGEAHTRIVIMPCYAKALSDLLTESLRQYQASYGAIPTVPVGADEESD